MEKEEELIEVVIKFKMTRKAKELLDKIIEKESKRIKEKSRKIAIKRHHNAITKEDVRKAIKEVYG